MSRPEYLVTYIPYGDTINGIYRVVGDTEKYWKCLINNGSGDTFLVNKHTLYGRGSDIKYHVKTKEEVERIRYRTHLLTKCKNVNYRKLSVKQLESIIKIAEEKEDDL
jgi:hypothetical protein